MTTNYLYVEELNHHSDGESEASGEPGVTVAESGDNAPRSRRGRTTPGDSGCPSEIPDTARGMANRKANEWSGSATARDALYMIQSGGRTGPVKIGYAANVANRLSNLQTGNPEPLVVILEAVVADPPRLEAELHKRFRRLWIRGEWFQYHPVIEAVRLELAQYTPGRLVMAALGLTGR